MRRTLFLTVLFVLCFSFEVPAEEVDEQRLHTLDIGTIVITPTRSETSIGEVAGSISVITQEDIERSGATTIPEALKTQPGLIVKDFLGNGKTVNIDVRGFGQTGLSNVLVLIDGRRINQVDLSGVDWTQIPLEQIERIEVVRTSAGVLYGDNAAGGAINIITKKVFDKPSIKVSTSIGSYSRYKENLNFNGKIDNLTYSGQASYQDSNGYRENNTFLTKDAGITLAYNVLDNLKLSLVSGYHRDSYGLPGALYESEMKQMGRRSTTKPEDHADTEDYYVKLGIDAISNSWGDLLMDVSWRNRKTNSNFTLVSYVGKSDIDTIGFTPRYILKKKIIDRLNHLIIGFDYYYSIDEINTTSSTSKTDVDITKLSIGPYFLNKFYLLDDLIITTGFRYERAAYEFESVTRNLSDAILTDVLEEVSPKRNALEAGLTYLFKADSSIFMKYAKSFRFGLVDEFFNTYSGLNTALKPQESDLCEIGVTYSPQDSYNLQLSLYNLDVNNEIYYDPNARTNTNYDKIRHYGVELSCEFKPFDELKIFSSYSYIRAKFNDGAYDENDVPLVPHNKVSVGLDLEISPNLTFFTTYNFIDKRYFLNDFGNEYGKLNSYYTLDTRISYNWKNLTTSLTINNLFDEKYSEYGGISGGRKYFYPSPERSFEFKASHKF